MDPNQEQLRKDQRANEMRESQLSTEAVQRQRDLEAQAAQQGLGAQQIAAGEQARYEAFDPEKYARAQADAAGAMQAYQARRMGANAGKAARLGNMGLQQAQMNALGQGYGLKQGMGSQAYGMRAGQQGQLGQFGAQKGQESLARAGTQLGFVGAQQQALGAQAQERRDIAEGVGGVAKTAGKAMGVPMEKGGAVEKNKGYIVGEKGEEAFVPDSNGTIIPNNIIRELSPKGKELMKRFLDDTFRFHKIAGK
jgi:hypothetical protein